MLLSQAQSQGADARRPLTVSEAMAQAKNALESFTVRLIGEVSEVSDKAGYKAVYFTVKDRSATLPCMMWLDRYRDSGVKLSVGMLVELTGRFTVYAPKGRMNFTVYALAATGEGDLRRRVAELARKLQREGLMDPARKRRVPVMPEHIGLVTSPRGDAVHDVLRTLRRRWPVAKVSLAGVTVEGPTAPLGIARGLAACAKAGCEVVLLVRGGGTYEELMPFNDENLARAVAACPIPVITGIGHEPDNSIADMVADVRASTPTAAAEAVSPDRMRLAGEFDARAKSMAHGMERKIEGERLRIERLATRPVFTDPQSMFATDIVTLDMLHERLARALPASLERDLSAIEGYERRLRKKGSQFAMPFEHALALRAGRLHDLSPLAVIARGYAIARDEDGHVVKSAAGVNPGDSIDISISDGTLSCTVDSVTR